MNRNETQEANREFVLTMLHHAVARSGQNVVARELGERESNISRWIKGRTAPTGEKLAKLLPWAESFAESLHQSGGMHIAFSAAPELLDEYLLELVHGARRYTAALLRGTANQIENDSDADALKRALRRDRVKPGGEDAPPVDGHGKKAG